MRQNASAEDLQVVQRAYARVSAQGWGLALGLLAGLGLFLATVVLVIQGGPNPGPHLSLLGVYFPGYDVTWAGAFLGFFYAFLLGYAAGWTIGTLYNRIAPR